MCVAQLMKHLLTSPLTSYSKNNPERRQRNFILIYPLLITHFGLSLIKEKRWNSAIISTETFPLMVEMRTPTLNLAFQI